MMDADNAKDKLQDILNGKEYHVYYEDNRNIFEVWWDRFVDWLGDLLSRLIPGLSSSSGFADVVLLMIIAVILILIGITVFLLLRNRNRSRKYTDHPPLQHRLEKNFYSSDHLTEAEKQESNHDYTAATRHLFLALLLDYHERGWLEARRWKTNWEYYAELRQINRHDAETFHRLAILFDEVVYGERILQHDEFLHYRNSVLKLLPSNTQKHTTTD